MQDDEFITALLQLDEEHEEMFGHKIAMSPDIVFIARRMFEKGKHNK